MGKIRLIVALLATILLPSTSAEPNSPKIEFKTEGGRFQVRGLSAAEAEAIAKQTTGQETFSVYTVIDGKAARTPLLGDYEIAEGIVSFTPRYPPKPGVTYRAVVRLPDRVGLPSGELTRDFAIGPTTSGPRARVTAVYPTAEKLPENLLKFYLHFSAPMSRGEVYNRVRLLDEKNNPVKHPFLELAEELWDPEGQRLTLYFDPGRIKRGLKPREEVGPALLESHAYSLVIDGNWPDVEGRPLEAAYVKEFVVGPPDDQQPDMRRWKLGLPAVGTREPLKVIFDEPLDSAMLERVISVRDPQGTVVRGEVKVRGQEREWLFQPREEWQRGGYSLAAEKTLEDLAGNSLGRPFEVDILRPVDPKSEGQSSFTIPFELGR